ncbi:MAG: hypothetical protein ABIM49_06700 [candidate division WOR-3 bacterium]
MKISRIIFLIGILFFLVSILFKIFKISWPAGIYHPLTYLRGCWTLILIAIGYHLLFERSEK